VFCCVLLGAVFCIGCSLSCVLWRVVWFVSSVLRGGAVLSVVLLVACSAPGCLACGVVRVVLCVLSCAARRDELYCALCVMVGHVICSVLCAMCCTVLCIVPCVVPCVAW